RLAKQAAFIRRGQSLLDDEFRISLIDTIGEAHQVGACDKIADVKVDRLFTSRKCSGMYASHGSAKDVNEFDRYIAGFFHTELEHGPVFGEAWIDDRNTEEMLVTRYLSRAALQEPVRIED